MEDLLSCGGKLGEKVIHGRIEQKLIDENFLQRSNTGSGRGKDAKI